MYDDNVKKLNDISNRLQAIFDICDKAGGVYDALNDYKIYQPAIIMHLIVCKEDFEKILFTKANISSFFSDNDMKGLSAIRNIAAHDYDGLNFAIIEKVIREYLPATKQKIDDFLAKQYSLQENKKESKIRKK